MPSIDVSPYVDLTVYDSDTQSLVDRALDEAQIRLPGWVPREGNTEVVLIEAMALQVSEMVYAINRLPGAITEVLLRLFGLVRDQGSAPMATVTFTVAPSATGQTVPAGTRVRLMLTGDAPTLDLLTMTDLVVAPNATTGTVPVMGDTPTTLGAGVGAGTALAVVTAVPYVDSAVLASPVTGGVDPEDTAAFLDRGAARLSRLVSTLVLPEHFTAAAVEQPGVVRATTLDSYDPGQAGIPGDHLGHVTVVVAGTNGAALSTAQKAALVTALEAQAMAAITVHALDATVNTVNVTVTVVRLPNALDADVTAAVTAALTNYLSPATWSFGKTVYWAEMLSVIDGATGVLRVSSLATPAGDLSLTGMAPLTKLGTLSITVAAP